MRHLSVLFLVLTFLCGMAPARAVTLGNDVIDRARSDGSQQNFVIAFPDLIFGDGIVASWAVWIEQINNGIDTSLALLGLEVLGNDEYRVRAFDFRNVGIGYNGFSSSMMVEEGWVLGAFVTNAKISFDRDRGQIASKPATRLSLAIDDVVKLPRDVRRAYSLQATIVYPVPLAPTLPMLLAGLAAVAMIPRFVSAARRVRAVQERFHA